MRGTMRKYILDRKREYLYSWPKLSIEKWSAPSVWIIHWRSTEHRNKEIFVHCILNINIYNEKQDRLCTLNLWRIVFSSLLNGLLLWSREGVSLRRVLMSVEIRVDWVNETGSHSSLITSDENEIIYERNGNNLPVRYGMTTLWTIDGMREITTSLLVDSPWEGEIKRTSRYHSISSNIKSLCYYFECIQMWTHIWQFIP